MHRRLGSAILSQLAFPGEKQPKFSMGEMPLGQFNGTIQLIYANFFLLLLFFLLFFFLFSCFFSLKTDCLEYELPSPFSLLPE